MLLYRTATEHINKHPYDVLVPPHFAMKIVKEVADGTFFAPFYEPLDAYALQKSKITIAHMVELYASKMSFTIIADHDVLSILHQIDAYVDEVVPLMDNPQVKTYIEKIIKLRNRIYWLFRKVLNAHPQWKDSYQERTGIFDIISILYRGLGIKANLPATLMEELRECPALQGRNDLEPKSTKRADLNAGDCIYDV